MNQTQIKYARERAANIRNRREKVLREKHTTPSVTLDCEGKLSALKAGRFKVPSKPNTNSRWWHDHVIFSDEVKGGLNQKAFDKDLSTLNDAFTKLNDELVLGDNEQALKLLEAFDA